MTAKRIEAVLRPASVAVVGASATPGSIGDVLCRNLREGGFRGPVFYVNPRHASIGDEPSYPDVRSLPQAVDVAIIATPPPTLPTVLEHCGERGVRGAIIVSAGFREGGEEGAACEKAMLQVARRYGLRLLGPNSFGVIRTDYGFNASCGAALPKPGRLALVSQSSALCAATLDWARSRHVGFSTVISTGVGDDIGSGDVLDFLARDAATDGIMLYLEGVGDARRFMSALRAAARVKPVVVMKAGRSLEGRGSLAFHTGSLVGGDDVFDAAMRRAGVLRIRDFGQLYSAASTLGAGVRMRGRRLGIVTNAGGPGQLAADRAGDRGLPVAELNDATLVQLHALLPPSTAEGNPVYVRGDASAQVYAQAAQACLQDGEVDALLAILTPFALTDADRFATELIAVATAQRKPVFTCWMGGAAVTAARQHFAENRVPTFPTPEAAVDAIAALALFTANQEQLLQVPAPLGPTSTPTAPRRNACSTRRARGQRVAQPGRLQATAGGVRHPDRPEPARVLGGRGRAGGRGDRLPGGDEDSLTRHRAQDRCRRCAARARRRPQRARWLRKHVAGRRHRPAGRETRGRAARADVRRAARARTHDRCGARSGIRPGDQLRARRHDGRGDPRSRRGAAAAQSVPGTGPDPPHLREHGPAAAARAPAAAQEAIEDMLLRVSEIVCELPDVGAIDINPVIVIARGAVVVDARIGVMPMPQPQRLYRHMAIHPYPSALEFPLDTPDGKQATIRAIRPEDAELERDFVHRLSEQSRFLRFMFGLQDLSPAMLSRFTQIDYDRELALIVVLRLPDGVEQQIGVARYITLPDEETCEFAIVVSDEWQGKGVARQLFLHLIDIARDRRLKVMTGITLRENTRMIDLSRALGFAARADSDEPELVRMTLTL